MLRKSLYKIFKQRLSKVCFRIKYSYEATYELLADAYNPYHPEALKIVSLLIPILLDLREFKDAERYARQLYDSLTKPIDDESEEIAIAADCLASVIYHVVFGNDIDGDIREAEYLSRKSIRIMMRIEGADFHNKGPYLHTLSRGLAHTGNENEVKDLMEQSLAIFKRTDLEGGSLLHSESQNVAFVTYDLANLHYRIAGWTY
jgi:hypothetical protein